jgi:hypothetical protein
MKAILYTEDRDTGHLYINQEHEGSEVDVDFGDYKIEDAKCGIWWMNGDKIKVVDECPNDDIWFWIPAPAIHTA